MIIIRDHWIFVGFIALWLVLLAVIFAKAAEPTPAQIQACTPDAIRLCFNEAMATQFSGNRQPVTDCMHRNYKLVSPQCRAAFK